MIIKKRFKDEEQDRVISFVEAIDFIGASCNGGKVEAELKLSNSNKNKRVKTGFAEYWIEDKEATKNEGF